MRPVSPRLADCRPRLPLGAGHSGGHLGVHAGDDVEVLRFAPIAGIGSPALCGRSSGKPAGRWAPGRLSPATAHQIWDLSQYVAPVRSPVTRKDRWRSRTLPVSGRTHQALAGGSTPSGLPATGPSSTSAISTTTASPPAATAPSSSPTSPPHDNNHPPKDQQQPPLRVRRSVMLTTSGTFHPQRRQPPALKLTGQAWQLRLLALNRQLITQVAIS